MLHNKRILVRSTQSVCLKYKHKSTHWSLQTKKKTSTDKALQHFDEFYKTVYGKSWFSVRHGLIATNKYVAVVNNYSDIGKTITELENSGAINMRTLFSLERERLAKQKKEDKREKDLKRIFKLDKSLELESVEVSQNEVHIKTRLETIDEPQIVSSPSVTEALKHAEIDESRIIDSDTIDLNSTLYQFLPATKIKGREDFIPEGQHYRYYESTKDFSVPVEKEYKLDFPENLMVYCYEKSNHTAFKSPRRGTTNVLNYYLLDGGSLLPVLTLGLKPGCNFLDICCAPGGKTYIALQTLYPDYVVCNDIDHSRIKRIESVLRQYFYDIEQKWYATGRIKVIQHDARFLDTNKFDFILVDVPCTNDRLSVHENDNNWFKSSRTKERLQLPELQSAILSNALKLVRVGGTVVYSTCSLSPIQNDGVVNMALKQIWNETNIEIIVKDMSAALEPTKCVFRYAHQNILKYGHLVVPYLPQNYGPMYFCKLQRIK